MPGKQHTSARTERRAAERAALKAANKAQSQPLYLLPSETMTATASGLPLDGNTADFTGSSNPNESHPNTGLADSYKATGPRSEAGKQTSARNAIKHGACAVKTLILPTESLEDYLDLETRWLRTYRIDANIIQQDPVRAELVRTAARAEWYYLRSERNYSDTEFRLLSENPDLSTWTEEQDRQLRRVLRYRVANANILNKHRKEIEAHIKARASEAALHQNMQHKDAKMAMAKERQNIHREKNKPFDLEEELEMMRQKAIKLGFRQPESKPAGN